MMYVWMDVRYVDPYAQVEIDEYFDKFNKEIMEAKAIQKNVQDAVAEMNTDAMLDEYKVQNVVKKEIQNEDGGGTSIVWYIYKKLYLTKHVCMMLCVGDNADQYFDEEAFEGDQCFDDDEGEKPMRIDPMDEIIMRMNKVSLKKEKDELGYQVNNLVEVLTYVWNSLTDDGLTHDDIRKMRDKIACAIPTQFQIEEEEEPYSAVNHQSKRIYLCGKCKRNGMYVPKRKHICPFVAEKESN